MVGIETKLRERAVEVQKKLDALEAVAEAREGEQAGVFTEDERKQYDAQVETGKAINADLRRLQERSKAEIKDWMERKGVKEAGQTVAAGVGGGGGAGPNGRFLSFGEQLQAIFKASGPRAVIDERLEIGATGPTGGSASGGTEGGFLIEEQFMPGIMQHAIQVGVLFPRCKNVPIGEGFDRLEWLEMDDYDQSTGYVAGGVQVYFRAEAETVAATKPKMSEAEMKLHDLMGICYMTGRQLEDAPSLEAVYTDAFGTAFARKLDRQVFSGTGAGQLLGVMNSPSLVTVPKETGQENDSFIAENIMRMWARMPGDLRPGAVWFTCLEAEEQFPKMQIGTGASGQLVYMPAGGLTASPYGTIYGRPVIPFAGCKKLGDLGDILLANLGEYRTITKGDIRRDVSMHVRFLYDEMAFRFIFRVNGQPLWKKAITPENARSGFTQSPFITLAAR